MFLWSRGLGPGVEGNASNGIKYWVVDTCRDGRRTMRSPTFANLRLYISLHYPCMDEANSGGLIIINAPQLTEQNFAPNEGEQSALCVFRLVLLPVEETTGKSSQT